MSPVKAILRFAIVASLCVFPAAREAFAQTAPLIANVSARQTTNLDGNWQVIVDPYDVGSLDYRAKPIEGDNGFFKNHKPQSKSELVEYDFDSSGQLFVPGDWNSQRESLFFYEGSVWYKRSFDYTKPTGKRLFVHFGAANYAAYVYLNGQKLGEHIGGFTPFDFEITDKVQPKDNFLIVRVNNVRGLAEVPTVNTDWWNYGGITRPVALVEVPDTFIQNYSVQLEKGSTKQIKGWVQLNGASPAQTITIRIPEAQISQTAKTDANGRAEFSFPANLSLWSPENPKLYEVQISSDTDRVTDQIGFRSIEVRGTEILLNGKPVFLRGVSIHEEAPTRPGRAWSDDDARITLGWAKDLGCNFVRLAHYPHNEAMLRAADRMGLLVWAEIPVYWTIQWTNADTLHNAENQMSEMISRDRNRAALIIYSVANETPISEPRTHFLHELIQSVRAQDSTRLVSAALQPHEINRDGKTTTRLEDPIANDLDVMGNNEYIGWYTHKIEDADTMQWETDFQKPLIMSEFGADAVLGLHGDTETRWTEEYQKNLYEHQIAMLRRISFLRGMTPWVLKDFRSPRRTLPRIQDFYNRKGLVTEHGERKEAFFTLQNYYRELAACASNPGSSAGCIK